MEEPFDHSKLSCVEAIPFESEALTTRDVLRPIVSLAAGWSVRDGVSKSTDPLTHVIGPSLPR